MILPENAGDYPLVEQVSSREFAESAGLDRSGTEILEQVFLRVADEIEGALAILLGGSFFRSSGAALDVDILILRPDSSDFRRRVAIERVGGLKAEVFVESARTLEERLVLDRRNNLDGLGQMLLNSINLKPPCEQLTRLFDRQRQLAVGPAPKCSRAYVASQFQQALDALRRTQRASDRLAYSFELLQLLRQTFHALRDLRTEGSLKHFLRRLDREESAWSAQLTVHLDECMHGGHADGLIQFISAWMAREQLIPYDSLRLGANGVEIRAMPTTARPH